MPALRPAFCCGKSEFVTMGRSLFPAAPYAPSIAVIESASPPPWPRQIARRVLCLMWFKGLGTTGFMLLFFWGYFAVLRHPAWPPGTMPLTPLDAWIPFTPAAFPAYASLWVYVSLPPALFRHLRPLLLFGLWMAALCAFCLALFWLFPTVVPAAGIDWARYPELALIKGVDASGNACPSLHVASAVFAAAWLDRLFRAVGAPRWLRGLSALHCLVILWSTLATRQHVALDVLAGLLVGGAFAAAALRHVGRRAADL